MPDWRERVRALLADGGLTPTTEIDVVEELAQHVEDRCRELESQGLSETEATAASLRELEGPTLVADLRASLQRP